MRIPFPPSPNALPPREGDESRNEKSAEQLQQAMEEAFAAALENSSLESEALAALATGESFILCDETPGLVESHLEAPGVLEAPGAPIPEAPSHEAPSPEAKDSVPTTASARPRSAAIPPSTPVPGNAVVRTKADSASPSPPPTRVATTPSGGAVTAPAKPRAPKRSKNDGRPRPPAPARRNQTERAPRAHSIAWVLGLASAVGWIGICLWGWDYYDLALEDRPGHPKHALLRSSGIIGLSLAIVGTLLMLLNLTYLLRKKVSVLHRFGSLRAWMSFHVLTGLVGPAMIVLHTGFLPTSALGTVSLIGMLVVVTTGIIGRYIYSRVPHSLSGRELEIDEIRLRLGKYHERLSEFGVDARRIADFSTAPPARSLVGALIAMATGDRALRKKYLHTRNVVLDNDRTRAHAKEVLPLLRKVVREGQWLARYHEMRSLMGSWRFLHRWLAILMLILAGFHIFVGLRFGDLWVMP